MYSEYFLWITQVNTDRRVAREFVTFFEKKVLQRWIRKKTKPGPLTQTPKHPGSMVPLALLQVLGRAFGRMFCLSLEWLVGIHTGVRGTWSSSSLRSLWWWWWWGIEPKCLISLVWLEWCWNESNKVPFKRSMESGFLNELTCFGSTDFHALKPRTCTERLRSRVAKKASILVSKFQLCFLVFSRLTCCLITVYFCRSLEQSGAKQMGLNTWFSLLRKSQVSGIQDSYLWGGDSPVPGLGMRSWRASCQSVACPLKFGAPGYPVWKRST